MDNYADNEEFNTCAEQRNRRKALLSMNVEKLKRQRKKTPRVNLSAMVFTNEAEYEQAMMDEQKLLNNFSSSVKKPNAEHLKCLSWAGNENDTCNITEGTPNHQPSTVHQKGGSMLNFQRFELNDPLVAIENKHYINPAYYDSRKRTSFDLRQKRNKSQLGSSKSNFLKSAFWNPKTHMILIKRSEDPSYNVATNTLSFAKKYRKSAPKHRVRN